jgi:phage-related minor tail protein
LGEAGPEAVMPLSRGADGKLGVRAQGAGAPALVQHFSFSTGVSERDMMMAMRVARDQAVAITKGQIRQSMTRGGVFAQ